MTLWNKSFTPAPTVALRTQDEFRLLPEGQSEDLFGALLMMSHLLRIASPGTSWPQKVVDLIKQEFLANPLVTQTALGLPDDWERVSSLRGKLPVSSTFPLLQEIFLNSGNSTFQPAYLSRAR